MGFWEEFRIVLDTLRTQRARALLTLLGIILGVGTLVALSSAIGSAGLYMERTMQQASGEDIVSISRRWWGEENDKPAPRLNKYDSRALQKARTLEGAMILNRYSTRVQWGERWGQTVWVIGATPQALPFYRLEMGQGRFVSDGDVFGRTPIAVVGSEAAKNLLKGDKGAIGQELKLKGERFRVVGVMKPKPSLGKGEFWTWNKCVVVPETAFVDRFDARGKEVSEIVVRAPAQALADLGLSRLVESARAIIKWRHWGVENFKVTDAAENARSRMIVTLIVGALEMTVAGVCLLVGGINLMNIMLVSVLQRTREIGVRRAIGATRGNIRRTFLTEAAILAGVGGLLGVAGGLAFAWLLALVLDKAFGYWPFVFPWVEAAAGFGAALVTGVLFGLFPAIRAANLNPIDALRYE
ncbi:MAG: ABC transporter permease [Candidatus Sericytochromatia bacterium]|nr:ABC transporter permease [Candidatus Tanganyikabacteria bacterium]